ncbi:uncharacterized protein Eint_050075 [Encephalitozoon intestinalis ATCC 50506]|uniref:Uncharacterized protein n=1 Tax=Encephalitozoon intestinalis (strain ATCC 50506) TaxID=876142 RepID=W8P8Y4_ENCIT|nr:uncharacterized protein Eint_050075 [Encephalitozoon intestinalis ATCC 50506]AHL30098.1 hypothetical protein Eint_050075 [Encephalitozoon intestinalis ATCC 50506]UTX45166.1 hypothetical protein GPK93_05g07100 [Encephalitozoon intestinalis]
MRIVRYILSINLCMMNVLANTRSKSLLEGERLEKKLLNEEDILMMEHLKDQGFIIIYPSKANNSFQ